MLTVAIAITAILLIYLAAWLVNDRKKSKKLQEKRDRQRTENLSKYLYHRDAKMLAEMLVHDYGEIKEIRDNLKHMPYARDGPNVERNRLLRQLRRKVGPRYRALQSRMKRVHDIKFYSLVLSYIRDSS